MFLLWILGPTDIPVLVRLRTRVSELEDRVVLQKQEPESLNERLRRQRGGMARRGISNTGSRISQSCDTGRSAGAPGVEFDRGTHSYRVMNSRSSESPGCRGSA
jgi:hypothetical protein